MLFESNREIVEIFFATLRWLSANLRVLAYIMIGGTLPSPRATGAFYHCQLWATLTSFELNFGVIISVWLDENFFPAYDSCLNDVIKSFVVPC